MKNRITLLVFLFAPFYSFSQTEVDTVDIDQLEARDDIRYKKGAETPFTGVVVKFYSKEKKEYESNYVNGKLTLKTIWHKNGQKKTEIKFKDGLPLSQKKWDKNGKIEN